MPTDYTTITAADVDRAVDDAITAGEQHAERILSVEGDRTFANTLAPFDEIGVLAAEAYGRGPFLGRVHPDDEIRAVASAAEDRLDRWLVELDSRVDLYEAVRAFAKTDEAQLLSGERKRFLTHRLRDYRRAGMELDDDEREQVARLRARLSELSIAFQRNVDEHRDWIEVTRDDLDGLPDSFVERLSPGDAEGTYRVSLDYPERFPFLQQARRRDLRRALFLKSWNEAAQVNRPLIEEALALREQLAELLGYADWAAYAMEPRMADPEAVEKFYGELVPPLKRVAESEYDAIRALLEADEADDTVRPWDTYYYDTQLRRRDFGVDQNEVAEYFPLEQTLKGMFDLTAEVFGLRYRTIGDAQAWHPDVTLHEIIDADSDEHVAYFYVDLFPRPGKYTHAAAFDLVPSRRREDGEVRAVSAIVANFTPPTSSKPALLTHDEVVTLFHEFGHILHQCVTHTELAAFSGTATERDFVEAPSQIMENWCWDTAVLQRFARHHETGAPIPTDLVDQLVAARYLNEAIFNLRQCFLGQVDLLIHTTKGERDLDALIRQAWEITGMPFPDEPTFFLGSFAHLMGGYDAGYYGYLWSLVYGYDMFSRFEEAGVVNPEIGRAFREQVLEPGGSEDAMVLLRRFLGREPSNAAFLRKLGLETG